MLLAGIAGYASQLEAQSLYTPRNVLAAYKKGTRSSDGNPGKNYWQNKASYDISMTVFPPGRNITGRETIAYTNNSPDSLREIRIKLIQDIHRPGALRDSDADSTYLTSGLHIDTFRVNGAIRVWEENKDEHTTQAFRLSTPLGPGQTILLGFSWHYLLSLLSGREGMVDSTTFFLAYFYPAIAVYDDQTGWDYIHFNDLQEFYGDFNDYKCHIRAPRDYLVWSTGTLQNPDEVLAPVYAKRLSRSCHADEVVHIVTAADLLKKHITTDKDTVTWVWDAKNVSDMAFGVSDHFVWDGSSVLVDSAEQRRASVQCAYNDSAAHFREAVDFGRYAVSWFSYQWPGKAYPYAAMTIFQGSSDMEYPMMVNTEATYNKNLSRFLIDHEIAHTYFPFYMGINESRYAFMDEGWASALELLIGRSYKSREESDGLFKQWRVNQWIYNTVAEADLPIVVPSSVLQNPAYGNNAYGKPALAYLALKDLLGDRLFKRCLLAFMGHWNGKHPIPWDFFYSFNREAGRSLDWFWNNWFFSHCYIDLSLQQVRATGEGYLFSVRNLGGLAIPMDLELRWKNGQVQVIHYSPGIWEKDPRAVVISVPASKALTSARLSTGVFVDPNEQDNEWPGGNR